MANRGSSSGQRPKRSNRRVVTVGAAASLVLTVAPALVSPAPASANTTAPGNHRSHVGSTHRGAVQAYRARLRAAVSARASAQRQADAAFRAAVAPHLRVLAEAEASARTKAEYRAARSAYGEAVLSAKITRAAAVQAASVEFIDGAEQARIDYLIERRSATHAVAAAKFRHAVNLATAEYQTAVDAARGTYKLSSAPARSAQRRAAVGSVSSQGSIDASEAFRLATVDVSAVFRSQIASARTTYKSKVAVARKILGISMVA